MLGTEKTKSDLKESTTKKNRKPEIPLSALIEDADSAILFAVKYWESTGDRPGLEDAGFGMSKETISDIESLKNELVQIDKKYHHELRTDLDIQRQLTRAQQLVFEMSTFIEWYIVSSENDDAVEYAEHIYDEQSETDLDSPGDLAYILYDYSSLTKAILNESGETGGVSFALVDEGFDLVSRLVDIGNKQVPLSKETKKMRQLRNQLSVTLVKKLNRLRKAAQFIFREHPGIVKEVSSSFALKTQAAKYRANRINKAFYRRLKQDVPLRFLPKV